MPVSPPTFWTRREAECDFSAGIGMVQAKVSRPLPPAPHRSLRQIKKGEKGIWQRRFWEHPIRDQSDFARHRDLVHLSPVHAGLCARPEDWPFSSYRRSRAPDADFEVLEEITPPAPTPQVRAAYDPPYHCPLHPSCAADGRSR